jgi:hypothetical protein
MNDLIERNKIVNAIANTNFYLSASNWEEVMKAINSVKSELVVPILEIKNLRNEMDKILTNTTAEQNVKWTCIAMIDDLIEDYDGDKRED